MGEMVPLAKPGIVVREEFDGWAVLFDPATGRGFALDPVGLFYWRRLDGTRTKEALVRELTLACDQVPGDALAHLEAFLAQLSDRGLLA